MSTPTRREFLQQSGAGLAGLSLLSGRAFAALPAAEGIPAHQGSVVPGVHGYAEQSVAAGGTIHFRISSTVPHRLSICRLGLDPESAEQDELLHAFPEAEPTPQPIHPGSYIAVEKNLSGNIAALALEIWIRPWKLAGRAGVITQHDEAGAKEFGLFLDAKGGVTFAVGMEAMPADAAAAARIEANQWSHLVAVWDGAYAALFINGLEKAKWQCPTPLTAGKAPLRLGALGQGGGAAGFLDGDLAMPAIYRRALSPEEIAARFAGKALAPATGDDVLACWPLREQQGERLADSSGQRRDGRIINHATRMIPGPSQTGEVPRFAAYEPLRDPQRGAAVRLASDDLYDCRWAVTADFTVPATARSGVYVGRVAYMWEGKPHLYHITFIVRKPARAAKAPLLVLAATNTWRAYCSAAFPKPNAMLKRNVGTGGQLNSPGNPPAYSFYRRHAGGQGGYQIGLRMPFIAADPYLLYGKEYSHLLRAERFTQTWLEKSGYDYDVLTDLDVHRDPSLLRGYRAVMMNGHSEYWSMPAYHGLDDYLRRGGNLIVLSGNSMLWRVTFSPDEAIIECRKVDAPGEQMKPHERAECWHAHDGKRGGMFRDNPHPSYKLIGLDMLGFVNEPSFGPYVVDAADHFLFHQPEATGLKAGDEFGQGPGGAMPRAGGHEMDIRMSTFAALQEQPTPAGATMPTDPAGMTRLANGTSDWTKPGASAFDYFFRRIKPTKPQGPEMIYWERPEGGKVFNAGSIASGWSLASEPKLQALMRNVLAHFGVGRR
ncbi:MAG: LamG domain-containing protein [Verrucomicrobiota bacterium]